MRLLLINPRFSESFWSFKWAVDEVLPNKRALNPPLGLATLAALCPPHWQVQIVDENVEPIPLDPKADLIGVCGMGVQFPRQRELLTYYRERGYKVVAGGSYASLCPEKYAELADWVIAGEAELIWPKFCKDFEAGEAWPLYQETGEIDLTLSPTPRFDLLKLDRYSTATMQFSRGCPYRCDFCDIIVMFGRKPRVKSNEQIGRELDLMRAANVKQVFFVDDNLVGNRPAAKKLLRYLIEYQQQHGYRFVFGTEGSINLSQDPELLQLLREAGFAWIFIGIETTDPESLKETRKTQNTQEDMLTSVRRIYGAGIDILAGFIIGFDNDTLATFEHQHRFIVDSGIQAAMVGLLTALPRTPLYQRLQQEGRLIEQADNTDNTKPGTNIVPKRMAYDDMVAAYEKLYIGLLSDANIAARIRNKMRYMGKPMAQNGYSAGEGAKIFFKLIARGILPGGWSRVRHFASTLTLTAPWKLPMVVADWICGLAMREYVMRRFAPQREDERTLERRIGAVRTAVRGYVQQGKAKLAVHRQANAHVSLSLTNLLDRRFFRRAAPTLESLLHHTRMRVTLRIESLQAPQVEAMQQMLRRLARFGDRVSIVMNDALRDRLRIDSSVFHLVLQRPSA